MSDISRYTGSLANDLGAMLREFRERSLGSFVRGQIVEHAELTIDTLNRGDIRYIITVVFKENPPTNESPEKNMLQRVFSQIPKSAFITTSDPEEVQSILLSHASDEGQRWRLDDEWDG